MNSYKVVYEVYDWSDSADAFVEVRYSTVIHADSVEAMYHNFEYETAHTAEEIIEVVELDDLLSPVRVIYKLSE